MSTKAELEKELKELKKAVYKKCVDCCGDDVAQARLCVIRQCPIFKWKPRHRDSTDREKGR